MSISSVKTGLIKDDLLVGNAPYNPVTSVDYLVVAGGGGSLDG